MSNVPIDKPSRTLTAEQITSAATRVTAGERIGDVATSLGVKYGSLYFSLKRRGVATLHKSGQRTNVTDSSVFSDPSNNERAAYFIGLLMADGSISKRGGVVLALQESDRHIVDELNKFLGERYTVSNPERANKDRWNRSRLARINFQSAAITADLARFGVTRTKSTHGQFADIIAMSRHIWRGMVDGDGSLFFNERRGYPSLALCGCPSILKQFLEFVRTVCPTCKSTVRKTHNTKLWQVCIGGRHAKELAKTLYDRAAIALERKALLAVKIMAWQAQRNRSD